MAKTDSPAHAPGKGNGAKKLPVKAAKDGSVARGVADLAVAGLVANAYTLKVFSEGALGEVDLCESFVALQASVQAAQGGDLRQAESLLMAQALALNAMFTELARRAASNMGQYREATESYMRLAFKAQGQCRATLEALATIKNPPTVFARQANINNGGQQQVNNGGAPATGRQSSRAANPGTAPTELLEKMDGERLDTGAAGATGGADPNLAPVGTLHRSADG